MGVDDILDLIMKKKANYLYKHEISEPGYYKDMYLDCATCCEFLIKEIYEENEKVLSNQRELEYEVDSYESGE